MSHKDHECEPEGVRELGTLKLRWMERVSGDCGVEWTYTWCLRTFTNLVPEAGSDRSVRHATLRENAVNSQV